MPAISAEFNITYKNRLAFVITQGGCFLFITAEFFAELCCPALEPHTVIGLELSVGTQLRNYVAGMIAQGRGETDYEGHKRPEYYVLQTVSMFML